MCSATAFAWKSDTAGTDWTALTPQIESALGKRYSDCDENSRGIDILKTADLGVPVAIVAYCHMGAYTSDTTVVWLKDGKPVVAKFRDHGKIVHPEMLDGSSVENGTGVELYPDRRAVLSIAWRSDEQGKLDECHGTAYAWNPATRTFDAHEALSKDLSTKECARVEKENTPAAHGPLGARPDSAPRQQLE
jgi:hypothetical protein